MTDYCAFLRAINVGGRTVKMDALRGVFMALGFAEVRTLLASGNVLFASSTKEATKLERLIENGLRDSIGLETNSFVRTSAELRSVLDSNHVGEAARAAFTAVNIAFLQRPLSPPEVKAVAALRSEVDELHVEGRHVYWLCRVKQSESKFTNARLERATRVSSTIRGWSTVHKIVSALPG